MISNWRICWSLLACDPVRERIIIFYIQNSFIMKRLKLEDFKLKNLEKEKKTSTNVLLGQVLGDCHDEPGCTWVGAMGFYQDLIIKW